MREIISSGTLLEECVEHTYISRFKRLLIRIVGSADSGFYLLPDLIPV